MTPINLFDEMNRRFGTFPDGGVVCSNGNEIQKIVCEIDWYTLYNVMDDKNTLYVVHHPVSDFALGLCAINPAEKEEDIRSDVQNWLLEFRARELGMNLAVAHTVADRMLETGLADACETVIGLEIIPKIDAYFDRYFNPHPAIVVKPQAHQALLNGARAKVVLGTYGYEAKPGFVYVDECGCEETDCTISIPHSLVDATAMKIWKREGERIMRAEISA